MLRILKYRFKIMISNKVNVFWTILFPIVLVSLFHLAFSNISEENLYKENKVGVVTTNKDSALVKMMRDVKDKDLNLFTLEYLDKGEGLKKLEDKKINAVVEIDNKDNYSLTFKDRGYNQIMIESFLNKYKQTTLMIEDTIEKDPNVVMGDWLKNLEYDKNYVKDVSITKRSNDQMVTTFYSAIAMACLFGMFLSMTAPITLQPNISYQGARVYVSPMNKRNIVIADLLSVFSIIMLSMIILMLYMANILKINFSDQINYIMLIISIGALLSTCLGYFISLLLKKRENIKVSFIVAFTLIGSFFSGMMGPSIKYYIEQAIPFIKYINPVALITDSFNLLYYYDDFSLIKTNLYCLLIMAGISLVGSIIILRRDRYDSI